MVSCFYDFCYLFSTSWHHVEHWELSSEPAHKLMTNSRAESVTHASPCGCNVENVGKRFAVFWLAVIFSLLSGTVFVSESWLILWMRRSLLLRSLWFEEAYSVCVLFLFLLRISVLISFCACLKATPLSVSLSLSQSCPVFWYLLTCLFLCY